MKFLHFYKFIVFLDFLHYKKFTLKFTNKKMLFSL